jgi:hypothetical protein
MRRSLILGVALAAALLAPGCAVRRAAFVIGPPPPPRYAVIGVAPGAGWVWAEGYWDLRGRNWVWAPGRWVRAPHPRAAWVSGRWVERGRGHWRFQRGHWRN